MISLEMARKLKLCKCGCGEMISVVDKKGRPHDYSPGHSSRIKHGMKGRTAPNAKGGIVTRQGYIKIYVPLDERVLHNCRKDGYEFEHRYVMEKIIGRKLTNKEAVHHINGNKADNRLENLQLMTNNSHAKHEGKLRPINPQAIEAMRKANIKLIKDKCRVDGCLNDAKSNGLCNKHHHWYRRGILIIDNDQIVVNLHTRQKQQPVIKQCQQCGNEFVSHSNRGKYCELCRTPYQHVKRNRAKRRNADVVH